MEATAIVALSVSFLGVLTFYLLYQKAKFRPGGEGALALSLKCLATLCAAGLALYGALAFPIPGKEMLTAGLFICAAADVLLRLHFLTGMGAFALGHVCYSLAFVRLAPPGIVQLAVFLLLTGTAFIWFFLMKKAAEAVRLPFLFYGLVLSVMLTLASSQRPALLAGAALFVLSDALLARRILLKTSAVWYDYLCLGVYYLAQFLIGLSTVI